MIYKYPESVLVVIYTLEAEVLLMQRQDISDFWQSVTGSLQKNETPLAAAQREVWEETGLVANANLQDCHQQNRFEIKPPWKAHYAPNVTHNTEYVFTLLLPGRQPIQINPHEHRHYCWLSRPKAIEKVTSYTNRAAILQYVPLS